MYACTGVTHRQANKTSYDDVFRISFCGGADLIRGLTNFLFIFFA